MKCTKLTLDESLLDDFDNQPLFGEWITASDIDNDSSLQVLHSKGLTSNDYDDEFIDLEGTPSINDHVTPPVPGPTNGTESGIASMLISAINDEWSTIDKYNSILATIRETQGIDPTYYERVLSEITSEENRHVGQLQELLKQISPNTQEITKGQQEAKTQMNLVNGKLQVQFWDTPPAANSSSNPNEVSDLCTIENIDDEM